MQDCLSAEWSTDKRETSTHFFGLIAFLERHVSESRRFSTGPAYLFSSIHTCCFKGQFLWYICCRSIV